MFKFTDFLKARQIEISSARKSTCLSFYQEWVQSLIVYIEGVRTLLPQGVSKALERGLEKANSDIISCQNTKSFIKKADFYSERIIRYIHLQIKKHNQTKPLVIPAGYPFDRTVIGVKIQGALLLAPDSIALTANENSVEGMSDHEAKKTKWLVSKNIGSIDWLQSGLAKLETKLADIHHAKPHAEMVWIIKHHLTLLNYLKENKRLFSSLPILDDELWDQQLAIYPRLQFVVSSSCCIDCQYLFSSLRLELNEMGVRLPIVIYANSPTNCEQSGPVYIVKHSGDFFNTQLQCDTPLVQATKVSKTVSRSKLTKSDVDYLKLRVLGSVIFPFLVQSRFRAAQALFPDHISVIWREGFEPLHTTTTTIPRRSDQYIVETMSRIDSELAAQWIAKLPYELMISFGDIKMDSSGFFRSPHSMLTLESRLEHAERDSLKEVNLFYIHLLKILSSLPAADEFTNIEEALAARQVSVQACCIL